MRLPVSSKCPVSCVSDQFSLGELVDRLYLLGCLLAGFHNCPFAHRLAVQIFQDFCGAFQGNKVILMEVHHLRFDPFTILHRLTNPSWKFAHRETDDIPDRF